LFVIHNVSFLDQELISYHYSSCWTSSKSLRLHPSFKIRSGSNLADCSSKCTWIDSFQF